MQKFGLKLGLSIAEMLCCNPLCGLISLVMVLIANSKFKAGDVEGSDKLSKVVNIVLIVGVVLTVIGTIVSFLVPGLLAGLGNLGNSYSY